MRVAIALSALCTLGGCFGNHQDPNDPQGRDFALEDGSPPSAAEAANPEPKNEMTDADRPPTTGSTPCGPDFKWCRTADTPMATPNADCCWSTAKQCYDFAKDPSVCDAIRDYCDTLPVPPPPVDPNAEYEKCVLEAKECLATADDPRACEMLSQRCEALLPAPAPTPYEQCAAKIMDCYAHTKDPAECDRYRLSCEALREPSPPPAGDPAATCYERVMHCYAKAGEQTEMCDALRKSCENVEIMKNPE